MRAFTLRTATWLLVGFTAGCLGPVAHDDGIYRHRDHGYVVSTPGVPPGVSTGASVGAVTRGMSAAPSPWQRIELEGATLAFRSPHSDTLMIKSRCGRPVAGAQLMARHLLIGLPERKIVEAHPFEVAGVSGWLQVVDTANQAEPVRLKTVTLVTRGCSFDLVMAAASARFAQVEPVFDHWLLGFRFVENEPEA